MNHPEHMERLRALHSVRLAVSDNAAFWRERQAARAVEDAPFLQGKTVMEAEQARLESEVRVEALRLYGVIPNASKTFLPGVTIKEVKVYGYDPATALAWAVEHKVALKLDEPAFKKLIEYGGAPGTVAASLTVAIAQDLGPVIAAASMDMEAKNGTQ